MVVRACRLLVTGGRPALLKSRFVSSLPLLTRRFPIARFMEQLFGSHRSDQVDGCARRDSTDCPGEGAGQKPELL